MGMSHLKIKIFASAPQHASTEFSTSWKNKMFSSPRESPLIQENGWGLSITTNESLPCWKSTS